MVDTTYLAENIQEFEINTFVVQKNSIDYKVVKQTVYSLLSEVCWFIDKVPLDH